MKIYFFRCMIRKSMRKRLLFIFASLGIAGYGNFAIAQTQTFFVSQNYDVAGRSLVEGVLLRTSEKVYWYAENGWWDALGGTEQSSILAAIDNLNAEFEGRIYPELTARFGNEWNPGIDNDPRLTILFHRMKKDVSGYWRSDDEYYRLQGVSSNEREMIYLSAEKARHPLMKSYLAHEFAHLIVFNQKERRFGAEEDVWVHELIAELAPSFLGYDDILRGSIFEQRIKQFLSRPTDSLTEWRNDVSDYGTVRLFGQYLVDHYGWNVIADLGKTRETGIAGINDALSRNGFMQDFVRTFTDWIIALVVRNCTGEQQYCYKNPYLKDLRITPSVYFLPTSGEGSVSVTLQTKDWAGNWYKLVGGHDTVSLEFRTPRGIQVRIPYIIEYSDGTFFVKELMGNGEKIALEIPNLNREATGIIIMPIVQEAVANFSDAATLYTLSWTASVKERELSEGGVHSSSSGQTSEEIEAIQKRLREVQDLIGSLRAQIATLSSKKTKRGCGVFARDMFYGMRGEEVRCLQQFLKNQGTEIYPEGLVTGNFLDLTKIAVIRFQEKYASEILAPLGLARGTGFVGPLTREKINRMGL